MRVFTGIVEEQGRVAHVERHGDRARLEVACGAVLEGTGVGDSVAVDGCCLTVAVRTEEAFTADLMGETLAVTTLGDLAAGDRVNLERPVAAGERFGGHLVQGHVDAVGTVAGRRDGSEAVWLTVEAPAELGRYLVPRGSVAVAGVSLTVTRVDDPAGFQVALVPHTLQATTLGSLGPGDRVNLEVDVLAKYVERMLAPRGDAPGGSLRAAVQRQAPVGSPHSAGEDADER